MDVLVLIDKLDDLVHNARPVPLTDQVRVDREEIYDLLDQMRATIPEEIKQARWIVKERQEMLAEAKREAERIVKEAREQQARLVANEEITRQAERAAEEIVEEAREREREIRLGAEDYADDILSTLEVNLQKFLQAVQRGRDRLQGREREPSEIGWLRLRRPPGVARSCPSGVGLLVEATQQLERLLRGPRRCRRSRPRSGAARPVSCPTVSRIVCFASAPRAGSSAGSGGPPSPPPPSGGRAGPPWRPGCTGAPAARRSARR